MRKKWKKSPNNKTAWERESVCVFVCEREKGYVCEREKEYVCACVCVCVWEREKEYVCVCFSGGG